MSVPKSKYCSGKYPQVFLLCNIFALIDYAITTSCKHVSPVSYNLKQNKQCHLSNIFLKQLFDEVFD